MIDVFVRDSRRKKLAKFMLKFTGPNRKIYRLRYMMTVGCIMLYFCGNIIVSNAAPHPLVGTIAPEINVNKWFNLKEGQASPTLKEYKDKVVYLYCFQSWCPGCHKYGFPTLKKIQEKFKDNDDIAFFAVQTVFEGFESNSADRIESIRKKYDIDIPFGHDDGKGRGSLLMRDYQTRGTPWNIIIDKQGKIVFSDFHIDPDKAIAFLDKMVNDR